VGKCNFSFIDRTRGGGCDDSYCSYFKDKESLGDGGVNDDEGSE